jgi:hypothetical protein
MNDINNTFIVVDWDDTLFPTSWVTNNNIDLTSNTTYSVIFSELDNTVYNLLNIMKKYGRVIIVTNASMSWFNTSSYILPKTNKFIKENIPVYSARDIYSSEYPNDQNKWKKILYIKLFQPIVKSKKINNIISIGDGPSEFYALINLAIENANGTTYFKSLRLIKAPNFMTLLDQIRVIHSSTLKFIKINKHLDLVFGSE